MMKSITPVISVILLILITIVASASAFFFINSSVGELESQGTLDTFPGMDNSRLNLVSITGSKFIVRNDGTSAVTELVVFINGEMYNYNINTPIMPGEYREINYTSRQAGEGLEIKIIYNKGKVETEMSPAARNTNASGYTEAPLPLNFQSFACNREVVNYENTTMFIGGEDLGCGCDSPRYVTLNNNTGFEEGNTSDWVFVNSIISTTVSYSGSNSSRLFNNIPGFEGYGSALGLNYSLVMDKIEFMAKVSDATAGDYHFSVMLQYRNNSGGNFPQLMYILHAGDWINHFNLSAMIPGETDDYDFCTEHYLGSQYMDCSLLSNNSNTWEKFTIENIVEKFEDAWGSNYTMDTYDMIEVTFFAQVYPLNTSVSVAEAYVDDFRLMQAESSDGYYCDANNDGFGEGMCLSGACYDLTPFDCSEEVINFDNKIFYGLNHSLACGCNSSIIRSNSENSGFEDEESFWSFNLADVVLKNGSNVSYINNPVASQMSTIAKVTEGKIINASFDAFITSNSSGERITGLIVMFAEEGQDNGNQMLYLIDEGPIITSDCGDFLSAAPNVFVNCEYNQSNYAGSFDAWKHYEILHINEDFENAWPLVDFSNYASQFALVGINFLGEGWSEVYYDNASFYYINTGQGFVCDNENDGIGDGACNNSVCTPQTNDSHSAFCEVSNYTWIIGRTDYNWDTGNNSNVNMGPCCGNDGDFDDFSNDTMICGNGVTSPKDIDDSYYFCTDADYTFFREIDWNYDYNENERCCGDDGLLENFRGRNDDDNEFNDWCCGENIYDIDSCEDDLIGGYLCGCVSGVFFDTCGDSICQQFENSTTCSYDCII